MSTDPFMTGANEADSSQPEFAVAPTLSRDDSQPELFFPYKDVQEGHLGNRRRTTTQRHTDYSRLPEMPIRKLSVQVMNALAQEQLLEEDWQRKPQQHLDFSDKAIFNLKTLKPDDFSWGGLTKNKDLAKSKDETSWRISSSSAEPVMPVFKLRTLNLDNNELTDDDFEPWTNKESTKGISGKVFRNLEVLRMKRNKLTFPMLLMPRLRELHLSHNEIVRIPPLAGLKQLEVLILSHNRIDVIDDHHLKDTNSLKRLHLNDNKLKLDASSLYAVLDALSSARELENLQFHGNPFCSYLNEYQIFVVMFLPGLKRIDDIDLLKSKSLKASMVEEAKRAGLDRDRDREDLKREFRKLDHEVKLRMKTEQPRHQQAVAPRVVPPKIDALIQELDEALIDSSAIQTSAALVYELASQITKEGSTSSNNYKGICTFLFDVRAKKASDDLKAVKEGYAATFVQQATLLAERSPDARPLLLRTLAKFCPMEQHRFGEMCLGALATLAKGGTDRQAEVMDVVHEMLIPFVAEKLDCSPVGDGAWETVVVGLSKMCCPELSRIMADKVVPHLLGWYEKVSTAPLSLPKLTSALIVIIKCAVQDGDHAAKVVEGHGIILGKMATGLLQVTAWQPAGFSDFLGVSGIFEGCLKSCPDKVMQVFRETDFPRKLLKTIRGVLDDTDGADENTTEQMVVSKKLSAALSLFRRMLEDPVVLQEQLSYDKEEKKMMFFTLLRTPAKATFDPLVLASSLECLYLLLSDEAGCKMYLKDTVSTLQLDQNPNKVLPLISIKRFQELYLMCERHTALQDDSSITSYEGSSRVSQLSDFTTAVDAHSHQVIVSIVHFISVFSTRAKDSSGMETCKTVSQKMNEQQRETLLFKLLGTPSNDVRVAVLRFLEGATNELDIDEQKQLVEMLNTNHVGQELPLLKSLMETLQRFICQEGETGDVFRSTYAGKVLRKAFQVLVVNAERQTYGNQLEEDAKLSLSREAVALLAGASKDPLLRMVRHPNDVDEELLRCEEIATDFIRIIKLEEMLHRPTLPDVPLELTWTGCHVQILLRFLNPSSAEAVQSGTKQGFRIFAQIADIIAGSCHGFGSDYNHPVQSASLPISAQDRAEAEGLMWNVTSMRLQVNKMDDHAYSDRYRQQDDFINLRALEQMVHFLEHGIAHNAFVLEAQGGLHGHHHHHSHHHHGGHWESLAGAVSGQAHGSLSGHGLTRPVVRIVENQKHARDHLTELVKHVAERRQEKAHIAREMSHQEDPEKIPLPEVVKAPTLVGEALARKFFIEDAWKHALQPDAVSLRGNVVPVVPRFLRTHHEEKFMDSHGNVGLHYYLAALLRAIYATLVVPMDLRFREAILSYLRNATVHSRLLALLEMSGSFVDCSIVAKFLRIMSMVLRMPPHDFRGVDHDHEGLHGEVFVAARFACRCIYMTAPLLESVGREYVLTSEQQTLAQESIRLLRSVCSFLSVVRFTDSREIQAECMEMAFDYVLPMPAVRGIFMCLLYDVQAGIGTQHGSGISKHYVQSILGRQEFHELCSEVLSVVVTSSPRMRYEVLELCNRFKVLKRQGLHTSFLKSLIDNVELHDFTLAMWQMLNEQPPVVEEKATEFFMGEWEARRNAGGEGVGIAFLACSDFYITAMGRPVNCATIGTVKASLWSASSKKPLAFAEIGPVSDDERRGGYIYQKLDPPVRIECGQEYRIVQESQQGTESLWHDGYITPSDAASLVSNRYANFLGGCSGQLYSYPSHFDGELRRAGMLNFKIRQKEWIRHCLDVELLQYGGSSYGLAFSAASHSTHKRMIVTNKRLLLMEVPRGGFSTSNMQSLAAGISQEFWLSNLVRITCHTDPQMFILGFMVNSRLRSLSEQLICVICHKSDIRQRLLETLSELSTPSSQVRIRPTRDVLIQQAINKWTSAPVICMNYAFCGDALCFYVLTGTELCEFELHFDSWVPSPKVQPYTGDDTVLSSKEDAKMVRRLKEEQSRGKLPPSAFSPPFGDHLNARLDTLDATMTTYYKVDHEMFTPAAAAQDHDLRADHEKDLEMFKEAQLQTLRMLRKPPLAQLREVEFDNGESPALKLTFQKSATDTEVVKMCFMDDVARERWRRCLASALRGQPDQAEQWGRHWRGGAKS